LVLSGECRKSVLLTGAGFWGAGFLRLPHVAVEAAGWGAGFADLGLWVAPAVAGILLALADGGIAQTALAARAGTLVEKLRPHTGRGCEGEDDE
jgi:hypothetical protein